MAYPHLRKKLKAQKTELFEGNKKIDEVIQERNHLQSQIIASEAHIINLEAALQESSLILNDFTNNYRHLSIKNESYEHQIKDSHIYKLLAFQFNLNFNMKSKIEEIKKIIKNTKTYENALNKNAKLTTIYEEQEQDTSKQELQEIKEELKSKEIHLLGLLNKNESLEYLNSALIAHLNNMELQEERIKKVESEEEQIRKDPNKRFSTFLETPKRPVPKPKQKPPPVEELHWKKQLASTDLETETAQSQQNTQNMQTVQQAQQEETITTSTAWTESVNTVEESTQFHEERGLFEQGYLALSEEGGTIITEAVSTECVFEERVHFEDEPGNKTEDCSIQECKEETGNEQQKSEATNLADESAEYNTKTTSVTEQTVEYKSEFERQLAEIQKQIQSIQELPSLLQAYLTTMQDQLTKIVEAKAAADNTQSLQCYCPEEKKEGRKKVIKKENILIRVLNIFTSKKNKKTSTYNARSILFFRRNKN